MYFSPQKSIKSCAFSCYKMIIKNSNFKNINTKNILISTKNTPITTLSLLFSDKLVENSVIKSPIISLENIYKFPVIIHCNSLLGGHYIVIFNKVKDKYLIGDPLSFGVKTVEKRKIEKRWSGYYISFTNLFFVEGKRHFYIPYSVLFFLKCLFVVLLIICVFLLNYFFIML